MPQWLARFLARARRVDLRSRRVRAILAVLSVGLIGLAVGLFVVAGGNQKHPPRPPAAAAIPLSATPTVAPTTTVASSSHPRPKPSPSKTARTSSPPPAGVGSDPVQISIPSIDVQAPIMLLGLNADQTVATPPLSQVGEAGWYKYSPTPGKVGPSIILGHVDSAQYGLGVFFNLGRVRPGDSISVVRADHRTADFTVSRVVEYPKAQFPSQQVYGNTTGAELRLITCGGQFNRSTGSYVDNIIVFASLSGLHG